MLLFCCSSSIRNIIQSSKMEGSKNKTAKKSYLTKLQQKSVRNLTEDMHKSRIAVQQQISKNCQEEQKLSSTFQAIKNEINQCVLQINTEQRKHDVLKQLVALLKGEMSKIQIKDMETKRKDQFELDKKLKQMRDDIDRIFLKKNHEVAKIAELKECANQRRSQRVVYSSLFKKIEKELKQSQQIYKNEILRSQKSKLDIQVPSAEKSKSRIGHELKPSSLFSSYFNEFDEQSPRFLNSSHSSKQQKNQKEFQQQTCKEINKNQGLLKLKTVLSHEIQFLDPNYDPSFYSHSQVHVNSVRPSTRVDKISSSKQNITHFQMANQQLSKLTERIKLACGVGTVGEINKMMNHLPAENQQLEEDIKQISGQIEACMKRNSEATREQYRRQTEDLEFNQFEEDLSLSSSFFGVKNLGKKYSRNKLRLPLNRNIFNEKKTENYQKNIAFTQFVQLCSLLKPTTNQTTQLSQNSNDQITQLNSSQLQQKCKQIDFVICSLIPKKDQSKENSMLRISNSLKSNQNQEKENRMSQQKAGQLNNILNKMNRYGHCQKFFGRDEFYQEYQKELTRKTKFRSKRS